MTIVGATVPQGENVAPRLEREVDGRDHGTLAPITNGRLYTTGAKITLNHLRMEGAAAILPTTAEKLAPAPGVIASQLVLETQLSPSVSVSVPEDRVAEIGIPVTSVIDDAVLATSGEDRSVVGIDVSGDLKLTAGLDGAFLFQEGSLASSVTLTNSPDYRPFPPTDSASLAQPVPGQMYRAAVGFYKTATVNIDHATVESAAVPSPRSGSRPMAKGARPGR